LRLAVAPAAVPLLAMAPVAVTVPVAATGVEDAERGGADHHRSRTEVAAAMAVGAAMAAGAAAAFRMGRRHAR